MSDLQGSERAADMILERIDAVRTGKQASWVRSGNAYLLTVFADRAVLEDLYPADASDPKETIEIAQLEDAARQWSSALKSLRAGRLPRLRSPAVLLVRASTPNRSTRVDYSAGIRARAYSQWPWGAIGDGLRCGVGFVIGNRIRYPARTCEPS